MRLQAIRITHEAGPKWVLVAIDDTGERWHYPHRWRSAATAADTRAELREIAASEWGERLRPRDISASDRGAAWRAAEWS